MVVSLGLILVVFESHESDGEETEGQDDATNEAGAIESETIFILLLFFYCR